MLLLHQHQRLLNMQIEYIIYCPDDYETIGATFFSEVYIPHIAVGNFLTPIIGSFEPSSTSNVLVITKIETYLYSPIEAPDPTIKTEIRVFTTEKDRRSLYLD